MAKSHLVPTTRIQHLRAVIDSVQGMVYLSQECLTSLRSLVRKVSAEQPISIRLLSQLLGKMVSCIGIVPWARLHCRALQWFLFPYQRAHRSSSACLIRLPPKVSLSLRWWLSPALSKGQFFRDPPCLFLMTDTSLFGWGAHLGSDFAQGRWNPADMTNGINWLELCAIHLALRAFEDKVRDRHVLVRTDNVAAKAQVNLLGGTHSHRLIQEAERLGLWSERHLRSVRAIHVSGSANVRADHLSRSTVDHGEWHLLSSIFQEITLQFGTPVIDLFASSSNKEMSRFFSLFASPGAEGVDALRSLWPLGLLYAFPPLAIISKVIQKMLEEEAELILIAPHWPRRSWFADLVSLSVAHPWHLPPDKRTLSQGPLLHPEVSWLKLTAWRLSGRYFGPAISLPES